MNIHIQTHMKYFFIIPILLLLCGCLFPLPDTQPPYKREIQKVVKSDEKLVKTKIFQDNVMKSISDIAWGELDPLDGPEIGVIGRGIVFYLDKIKLLETNVLR